MRNALPGWFVAGLVLLASSAALAGPRERAEVRTLILSEHPDDAAHRVYVAGRIVTVLRFEQPCDPAQTKLLGWEGRFEPLAVAGKRVVIEPLRALGSEEGVPLLVTLADGTALSFLVRQAPEDGRVDQQVDVFRDRQGYQAVVSALSRALKDKAALEEENARLRQENSPDHLLAALLASGSIEQTSLRHVKSWSVLEADAELVMKLYMSKDKAAVTFHAKNRSQEHPWRMAQVKLFTLKDHAPRTLASRAEHPSIAPGQAGMFAFVVDRSAFVNAQGRLENLALELYRHDGLRQGYVVLDHRLLHE